MSNIGIPRPVLVPVLVVLAAGLALAMPHPLAAQCSDNSCSWASCGTPALPVPFGGEIAPAGSIAPARDSTGYDPAPGSGSPYRSLFMDLDVANGWIFTGHSRHAVEVVGRQVAQQLANRHQRFGFTGANHVGHA